MKKLLARLAIATALIAPVPVHAQTVTQAPTYLDRTGHYQGATGMFSLLADGTIVGASETVPLTNPNGTVAQAQTLAPGACTAPQKVAHSATYVLAYIISGASPSLTLQTLGPDGATYMPGPVVTTTGSQAVPVFAGATGLIARWCNSGTNTAILTSALSS
jgi:hypothetical protein